MYEIRPETLKTFVENSDIKLPRFQRKQTWNEISNFKLCVSLFKKYPIGVTIIEKDANSTDQFLLDGRQRRNALDTFYNDPERIYDWARRFVKFKNNIQPDELVQLCREKINDYIEADVEADDASIKQESDASDSPDDENYSEGNNYPIENSIIPLTSGIDFLIEIIKTIHNKDKQQRYTGLTKPFYFVDYVQNLPYVSGDKIVSKKLRTFLREYKIYAKNEKLHADKADSFINFMHYRFSGNSIQNVDKFEKNIIQQWEAIKNRLSILDRIDSMFNNEKIGIIEVSDISQADSQKIFNIINSAGSHLTAAEIMSAQAAWNIPIFPVPEIAEKIKRLYENMDIQLSDKFVRWDYPATLLSSLTEADFIFSFDNKDDFSNKLTLGFKLLAGIILGKMKKDDVNKLSKNEKHWVENYNTTINDLNRMLKVIKSSAFFNFFQTWKTPFHKITSDFPSLCFIIVMYNDWCRKGKPVSSGASRDLFLKNAYALFDRLIFEYATSQWQASGDTRIARMLENGMNEAFSLVPFEDWKKLFNEILEKDTANDIPVRVNFMKPILYLLYSLKGIRAPQADSFDIDHIIPQRFFDGRGYSQKKDNLFNLGILPKKDNISKSDTPLDLIRDKWLISQIEEYEFISDSERKLYSSVDDYKNLFEKQKNIYLKVFEEERLKQ